MLKFSKILLCILIGYISGSLNPAAAVSKLKKVDLRSFGTGNLGATNTMLIFGNAYGLLVMILDIAKAFFSVKFAEVFYPYNSCVHIAAGAAAVCGHVFPFYMKFKGGKGLAAFAGMVLALDPLLFLFLLIFCTTVMIVTNHSAFMPACAGILFPAISIWRNGSTAYVLIATAVSILLICMHLSNLKKALKKEDTKIRDYIKGMFKKSI